MTGAEKLMLGMFAGGWKFGGKPAGRPGWAALACCMPGGGAVPGAAAIPGGGPIPGGGAGGHVSLCGFWDSRCEERYYPFLEARRERRRGEDHRVRELHRYYQHIILNLEKCWLTLVRIHGYATGAAKAMLALARDQARHRAHKGEEAV